METNLAIGEPICQLRSSLSANGRMRGALAPSDMAKRGRTIYQKTPRKLFLGPWLSCLGRRQVDLARAIEVTESYVSDLVNEKGQVPSAPLLLEISEWLGITVNDLYQEPPSRAAVEAIERMRPSEIALLARALSQAKPRR